MKNKTIGKLLILIAFILALLKYFYVDVDHNFLPKTNLEYFLSLIIIALVFTGNTLLFLCKDCE